MLTVFLRWWLNRLAELLPASLTESGAGADAVLVEPAGTESVLLSQRRRGGEVLLGHFTLGGEPLARLAAARRGHRGAIRLRLPPDALLERQVVLPLAAERELANVLRYEMDRLTPFPLDQLFWTASTTRRDTVRGRLLVRLSMVPAATLAPLLGGLRAAGLAPTALEVVAVEGVRVISLSQHEAAAGRPARGPAILATACAMLALLAVVLPFAQQSRRSAALRQELSALAPRADHAEALRRSLNAAAATDNVIAAATAQVGDPLAVLAAVTGALPDSSYLTALSLSHRQLGLTGEAAAAAGLLAALSAYPILTDVAFSAPVTHDAASQKDLFSIQSTVAPE